MKSGSWSSYVEAGALGDDYGLPDDEIRSVVQVEFVHDGFTRTVTTYWYDRDTAIADLNARLAANPRGRWGYVYEAGTTDTLYRVHRRQLVR